MKQTFSLYFYRNVLQKCCEMNLRSVSFCVINSVKRNYPPEEGAHIALSKYFFFCILLKRIADRTSETLSDSFLLKCLVLTVEWNIIITYSQTCQRC